MLFWTTSSGKSCSFAFFFLFCRVDQIIPKFDFFLQLCDVLEPSSGGSFLSSIFIFLYIAGLISSEGKSISSSSDFFFSPIFSGFPSLPILYLFTHICSSETAPLLLIFLCVLLIVDLLKVSPITDWKTHCPAILKNSH